MREGYFAMRKFQTDTHLKIMAVKFVENQVRAKCFSIYIQIHCATIATTHLYIFNYDLDCLLLIKQLLN